MKINWEKQYNDLRVIHSMIKDLMNKRIGGIPHFAGEPKKLPVVYRKTLEEINASLYRVEEWICREHEF